MDHEPLEVKVEPEDEGQQDAQLESVMQLIGREKYQAWLDDDAYETNPEVELKQTSLVALAHWEQHEDEDNTWCDRDEPDDEHYWVFCISITESESVTNKRQKEAGVVDVDGNESLFLVALQAALLRWFNSHRASSKFTLKNYLWATFTLVRILSPQS